MTYTLTSSDFGKSMLEQLEKLEYDCNIKLSRYQKALLAEIATVEQLLSIIVNSPIKVSVVRQDESKEVIEREVWLKDRDGNKLIFAHTTYNRMRLSMAMLDDLLVAHIGIGSVIMKHGLETYRRIRMLGYDKDTKTLFREYEIVKDGQVLFNIRESFSMENFLD